MNTKQMVEIVNTLECVCRFFLFVTDVAQKNAKKKKIMLKYLRIVDDGKYTIVFLLHQKFDEVKANNRIKLMFSISQPKQRRVTKVKGRTKKRKNSSRT